MDEDGIEIVGRITEIEAIATGRGIRRLKQLRKRFGGRRWRKMKGIATVQFATVPRGGTKHVGSVEKA
jgi:hypothetical protein